jgi:SAM-dependent methyltransferase
MLQSHREDSSLPWLEILEGRLTCQGCKQVYPITGGVPRLLTKEHMSEEVKNTVDGFGYEWQTFNDEIQGTYMTGKTNFLDFIFPTTEEFFSGKIVLDAGCGMGRFLRLGAEWGSCEIIGIDLSQSVDVAYQNTRHLPNAHVVQADILAPPFQPDFDYIFSIGVLQFLAEPKVGFERLVQLLNTAGRISIWVYAEENNGWVIRILSPIRRHITSRLPNDVLYFTSRILGLCLFAVLQLIYRPANEGIFGRQFGHLLPYNEYMYYSSQLSYHSIVSVVFDHLVPQLVVYLSRGELENWFKELDLDNVIITSRNNMSWRAQGTRATTVTVLC